MGVVHLYAKIASHRRFEIYVPEETAKCQPHNLMVAG